MSEFQIMQSAAAGMDAQRSALDLAARNVAAAEADGSSFERLVPRFALAPPPGDALLPDAYEPPDDPSDAESSGDASDASDASDARDGRGSVADVPIRFLGARAERGTSVDAVTEMVGVLDAQRAYEANASVFDIGKRLAERTIDLGRLQ